MKVSPAPRENIALVGSAPSSRLLAPYGSDEWEIWACSSDNLGVLPRVDVWFELHNLIRKAAEVPDFVKTLVRHPKVYLAETDPQIPGSMRYPREKMLEKYGTRRLSSSASYMLALCIDRDPKPKRVGVYGLDMSTTVEYFIQRFGFQEMVEIAEAEGIEVFAPPQSDVLEPPPAYAFREQLPMFWKMKSRRDTFMQRIKEIEDLQTILHDEKERLTGAEQATLYTQRIWLR